MGLAVNQLEGYTLTEVLHQTVSTIVYRATRNHDALPTVIKLLKPEYPTLKEITRFRYEYSITHLLDLPGVVKCYGLIECGNRLALVLEDFGGRSLQEVMAQTRLSLDEQLHIGVQIADTLTSLHAQSIIHKDIKPANIIYNRSTQQAKLTDFSIASRMVHNRPLGRTSTGLEGTVSYMSPEQTGRMNHEVDHRTDFYSLGVTLYELIVGHLPFQADETLELIHCHIAKTPPPPHEVQATIPLGISQVIMKLLEKAVNDRYQSALGLKADLEHCLHLWQSTGAIASFPLGISDHWQHLQIPEKLYGRNLEIEALLSSFHRVCSGQSELVLVSGYSGIGKSSLVQEVHKPIVQRGGYFVSGKFDQFKREIPYSAFVQAFRELMRQVMSESKKRLQSWKDDLREALGVNGYILAELIPEIEVILGKQLPVPNLSPSDVQNRFNLILQAFVQVFAKEKHPLVLFLDDLQWADAASLNLIYLLLSNVQIHSLLIVGSYRSNEVVQSHGLMMVIQQLKQCNVGILQLRLDNLSVRQVTQLLADTLSCDIATVESLSHILFKKTQGNPFFLSQLLKTLYKDHHLTFDPKRKVWEWDLHSIQDVAMTDNVVDFMISTIQRLPQPVQETLQLAACVGNQFSLNTLVLLQEREAVEVAEHIWAAVQAGLLLPIGIGDYLIGEAESDDCAIDDAIAYRFLHDRIQQAAYALIPDDSKPQIHLTVGRLLLKHTPPERLEEILFDGVNALNLGRSLITATTERQQLIQLNLKAGQKAKASAAYGSALQYLEIALSLLSPDPWQTDYDLALCLHLEAGEAAYLSANYAQAKELVGCVEQRARTAIDRARAYELSIQFHMAQSQLNEAIAAGLTALELLDISLPTVRNINDCRQLTQTIHLPNLELLDTIPEMTDSRLLAALDIMRTMSSPAYQAQPETFYGLILSQVQICLEHGHSKAAAFAYVAYGWLQCSLLNQSDVGYKSGQIALRILEQHDANALKCSTHQIFETFIRHWKEPLRLTLSPLLTTVQIGQETGDLIFASYAAMNYCSHLFLVGEPLDQVEKAQHQHVELLSTLKQELQLHYTQILHQITLNLHIGSSDPLMLTGSSIDERQMIPQFEANNYHQALFLVYVGKLILACIFGTFDSAVEYAAIAETYLRSGLGLALSGAFRFYQVLAYLGQSQTGQGSPQTLFQQALVHQPLLQEWAESAPDNYHHRIDLITAEIAQLQGDVLTAMDGYDRAIDGAIKQGCLHEAAIACERAAVFYLSIGKERIGQAYLTDAYYTYVRWGAIAKVRRLEEEYAQVLTPVLLRDSNALKKTRTTVTSTTSTAHQSDALDMATVLKASQAISSEIVLDCLLDTFIQITIENAGAQRGVFLVKQGEDWIIRAEKQVEQSDQATGRSPRKPISQKEIPVSIVHYVANTHESLILDDACEVSTFFADQYILVAKPRSILCFPILKQEQLISILYLENRLATGVFTQDRCELLKVLMAQLAISIENAQLYTNLQIYSQKLEHHSRELKIKNEALRQSETRERERARELKRSLDQLKQTQAQLIQTEKISSLGQLVAGVAHEVNNPVGFISGNLTYAEEYTQDIVEVLELYQQEFPNPPKKVADKVEDIDLDYLLEDLPKLLSSMKVGIQRIRDIMSSLRTFSRMDTDEKQPANIHDGIDSTLLILQHRIKAKSYRPEIQVIKEYGNLPEVNCFAGQLNQVFMNLLANAIDALEEYNGDRSYSEIEANPNIISIKTEAAPPFAIITISDNGPGITSEVQSKLFEPFFTTKDASKGTGLGLSISHQIVQDKHGGLLTVQSELGQGTTFVIKIPLI